MVRKYSDARASGENDEMKTGNVNGRQQQERIKRVSRNRFNLSLNGRVTNTTIDRHIVKPIVTSAYSKAPCRR